MSITLSSDDLQKLGRATRLLLSPLDHVSVDGWRSAVNHAVKELLHADSAGFLLPVSEGLTMYSVEHNPRELARYPDVVAPDMADGTTMWEQMIKSGVDTLANMYGHHYDRYLGSAYYQEYAGANGAHDTLSAAISVGGVDARAMASLHFWHARPDARLFGEREVALLRLLFPAFTAGVETQLRWGQHQQNLLNALDGLGHAALVCDVSGKLLHVTPCVNAMLQADPESAFVRAELLAMAGEMCRVARGRCEHHVELRGAVRSFRTAHTRYRMHACLYGPHSSGDASYVLASLERLTPTRRSADDLRDEFSLTRTEARVALLLGEGKANTDVARELFISPHTARRHTERVLGKMGLSSRSEVGAKLYV